MIPVKMSSSSEQIVLYDLASKAPQKCWSLNPWKSKFIPGLPCLIIKSAILMAYSTFPSQLQRAGLSHGMGESQQNSTTDRRLNHHVDRIPRSRSKTRATVRSCSRLQSQNAIFHIQLHLLGAQTLITYHFIACHPTKKDQATPRPQSAFQMGPTWPIHASSQRKSKNATLHHPYTSTHHS